MRAEIRSIEGVPALFVDGERRVPMLLFTNTETDGGARRDICARQIRMAKAHGLHLHSVCCHLPVHQPRGQRDLSSAIGAMDTVMREDDQAAILLRINLSLYGGEAEEWEKLHPGETVRCALHSEQFGRERQDDGSYAERGVGAVSIASDAWLEAAIDTLDELTAWFKAHPAYYDHLLGYHIAAEDAGEWFHTGLRENGVDTSPVNRRAWQQWLFRKYGLRVEAVTDAWGLSPKAYFDYSEIEVPADIPANDRQAPVERTLFTRPTDQRYVDYGDYSSELTVDRIRRLCAAAKRMTDGDKITVIFYGYYYELYDARTGHYRLTELLDCPDVDALAGPISYLDRNEGGTGAVMAPVDSIALHGKLWFVENDMRTGQVLRDHGPHDHDGWLSRPFGSVEHLLEAYTREWAHMVTHGMGCWYMDLPARGWISHPDQWECIERLEKQYTALTQGMEPLHPEVAVVVDERAMSVVAHAEACGAKLLYALRQTFYRAGIKFGWYTVEDVENGRLPVQELKVIYFLTPFRIDRQREEKLQAAARKSGAALVFVHGFGRTKPDVIRRLTGMDLRVIEDSVENLEMDASALMPEGTLFMPDEAYLHEQVICPFYHDARQLACPSWYVEPAPGVESLAVYTRGRLNGRIGAARCRMDGYTAVFVGAMQLTADGIREICRLCGAHIYSESSDALFIGDRVLAVHANAGAGVRTVRLRAPAAVMTAGGEAITAQTLETRLEPYQTTFWIRREDGRF